MGFEYKDNCCGVGLMATNTGNQRSSRTLSLQKTNALIKLPESRSDKRELFRGDIVTVILSTDWLHYRWNAFEMIETPLAFFYETCTVWTMGCKSNAVNDMFDGITSHEQTPWIYIQTDIEFFFSTLTPNNSSISSKVLPIVSTNEWNQ